MTDDRPTSKASLAPPVLPSRRADDLDRAVACDELAAAFAAGRLSATEHEQRVAAALEARTESDLRRLLVDLRLVSSTPAPPVPPPACCRGVLALLAVLGVASPVLVVFAAIGGTAAATGGVAAHAVATRLFSRSG